MWICLNDAFVSIVEDGRRPGNLLVRARRREHLGALVPNVLITETRKSDYRYRVSLPQSTVANLIRERVAGIDYGNFKGSTKDKTLHDMYSVWWGDHIRIQR